MVAIDQTNYLDFGNLLINEWAGSAEVFLIVAFILITYLGMKYNVSYKLTGIFMMLLSILTFVYAPDMNVLLVVIILIVAFVFYTSLQQAMSRSR